MSSEKDWLLSELQNVRDILQGLSPEDAIERLSFKHRENKILRQIAEVEKRNQTARRTPWHEYFMLLAKLVSIRSTCNSRKVGAVIVKDNRILATGYNGAVHGAPHCSDRGPDYCFRREIGATNAEKHLYCVAGHAETNALMQAARYGISVEGATVYCTLKPCNWCIKQMIQVGIQSVVYMSGPYESSDKGLLWDSNIRRLLHFRGGDPSTEAIDAAIVAITGSSERKLQETE